MTTLKQFITPYPKNSCDSCFGDCGEIPFEGLIHPFDKNSQPLSLANECPIASEFTNFNCVDRRFTNFDRQPVLPHPQGETILNNNFGLGRDKAFFEVDCGSDNLKHCSGTWAVRDDARIHNNALNQAILLDKPPFSGHTPLNEVYSSRLDNYGKTFYNTYDQIHSGQIQYYVNHSLENPLFQPVFQIESDVASNIFKDPMGALKPEYKRNPLSVEHRNISEYSFDRDSMSFREDITSRNMAQMNQRDWSKAWKNVNK
jgi:hypothetical protein